MTNEYRQSLSEVNTIIHYMDIEYLKKIPRKLLEFITNNMDKEYIPNIDRDIPINEQELKKDTKVLISLLYRNYWCDEEKKQELIKEDLLAKKKYEQELKEKYNPDNLFKNREEKVIEIESKQPIAETAIIEYKESLFTRIKKWIKSIFGKV